MNIADCVSFVTNALWRGSISPEAIRLARNELRSRLARPGATVVVGSTRVHPLSGSQTSHQAWASDLSHEKESAQIVILTSQIADDNTRGNSSQSHQGGETGGVMFAKSNSTMKEKLVQIVLLYSPGDNE